MIFLTIFCKICIIFLLFVLVPTISFIVIRNFASSASETTFLWLMIRFLANKTLDTRGTWFLLVFFSILSSSFVLPFFEVASAFSILTLFLGNCLLFSLVLLWKTHYERHSSLIEMLAPMASLKISSSFLHGLQETPSFHTW